MGSFFVGMLAGYAIAIPVGAIAILIVQVGIRFGFWPAASAGAGAATADLTYSVLAVMGGAALANSIDQVQDPLRWGSAAVLATIAVAGLIGSRRRPAPVDPELPPSTEYARTYLKFLGLTIVNPLTVVYFAAFVIGLGLAEDLTAVGAVLFAAGAFVASLSWQTFLAGIGAVLRHRLPAHFQVAAVTAGNLVILTMAAMVVVR